MGKARELKSKIRSIRNTQRVTRTMELVATAKSKVTQDRVNRVKPYAAKLAKFAAGLGSSSRHPLLEVRPEIRRMALLVVTANRGFCGGYNSNVLALAEGLRREAEAAGREVDLYVFGKKGLARYRFLGIAPYQSFTHIEDKPRFPEAEEIADPLMGRFLAGEIDEVKAVSTRYHSAAEQRPGVEVLLPITPPDIEAEVGEYIYEPEPESILSEVLPLWVRTCLFRVFLEAAATEQLARRVAMKLATDNAAELIKDYTLQYNRSRQASITQEIMEVIGGASALE